MKTDPTKNLLKQTPFLFNRKNLARVEVYYRSMNVEIISQMPRYKVTGGVSSSYPVSVIRLADTNSIVGGGEVE